MTPVKVGGARAFTSPPPRPPARPARLMQTEREGLSPSRSMRQTCAVMGGWQQVGVGVGVRSRPRSAHGSVWLGCIKIIHYRSHVDAEPGALALGARGSLGRALLHGLLAPAPAPRHHHLYTAPNTGSLPPSPADSGVSDVESSSSGAGSAEELKARLQPPPPAPFHAPFLPFYQHHQIATSLQHHVAAHPRPPVFDLKKTRIIDIKMVRAPVPTSGGVLAALAASQLAVSPNPESSH
ncbi:unnamed protein product, partial [Iphiclides podalirius]